ncbi:hypothetical protein GP486_003323 [Trichoglossum hirsutum]|uniref:Uncharacterized protein n=1 Tax=Trichoglossum hirsutum TaxID=265104 RepID=A0A9P8RQV2_9PEZI|nr:hypothetical protein GP486_003323 [Trichoglossum hirsutum]
MSLSFTTHDADYVPSRAPLREGSKTSTRDSDQSLSRGQDQSFDPGVLSVNSQSNVVYRKNDALSLPTRSRKSINQTELGPQMLKVASPMDKQQTFETPSTGEIESSRHRRENLAEENARLRLELEALWKQKEDVHDAMDKMLSDLIAAQSGLEEKEAAMNRQLGVVNEQNIQLERLRQTASSLSTELEEKRITRRDIQQSSELEQAVSKLKTEIREKDIQLRERDHILREREVDWKVELHALNEKLSQQQRRCEDAVAELHELQAADTSQAKSEKAKALQYLQELQQLRADISEKKVEDNSQALDQLKASHAAELAELRRISNFFKNNSERLSKQIKEMMAENRVLKESIGAKDRENSR